MNNELDFFKTLVEKAKEISLTERERSKLFSAVDSFIERNPIQLENFVEKPKADVGFTHPRFFKRDFYHFSYFQMHGFRTVGALLLLAVFGTGTSFAAQGAVPGDILYPIKVNINEGIKAALLSGVERSEFDVSLIKTRIEEAKTLAVRNELSDKKQAEITTRIDTYVSQVQDNLENLTEKGDLMAAFEISSKLEATLEESEVKSSEPTSDPLTTEQAVIVEKIVKGPRKISTQVREETENKIYTLQTNDEDTLAIAQTKFESVKKSLGEIEEKIFIGLGASAETSTMAATTLETTEVTETLDTDVAIVTPTPVTSLAKTKTVVATDSDTEFADDTELSLPYVYELLRQGEIMMANKEYNEAFRLFREAYSMTELIKTRFELEGIDVSSELEKIMSDLESAVLKIDTTTGIGKSVQPVKGQATIIDALDIKSRINP